MNLVHTSWLARALGRDTVCRVEGVTDRFALTFDDGPSPTNTPRLLDVLARHGARGTFFVLSRHARRYAAVLRRLHEAGHEIGLHGRDHFPPALLPGPMLRRQIDDAAAAVREACDHQPGCYRAPFGWLTRPQASQVRRMGYVPVLGDVYPEDPHEPDPARIARVTLARLRPGSIVILHDSSVFGDIARDATLEAVDRILRESAKSGLKSVSVREMLESAGR
jgi:peptidoglycan/xylan/chitin deacetylase (PgdA/CDA1 family)